MSSESENPAPKKSKYIEIQGFVSLDEKGNYLFPLSPKGGVFKVSAKDAISPEFFKTTVGGKFVCFANVIIAQSDKAIEELKEGTGRTTEESKSYSIGVLNADVVIGNLPKPPGGVGEDELRFLTKVVLGNQIVEIIQYKSSR